eukprot:2449113-Pyramimonas_sp.AAC.1
MSRARESPVQGKPFAGARIVENDWSAKPICAEQPPRARWELRGGQVESEKQRGGAPAPAERAPAQTQ